MLQRMQQSGLIERSPDPHDARATRVALSDKGRATHAEALRIWDELERLTVAGLTQAEQAELRVLLGKVSEALDDRSESALPLAGAPLPTSFILSGDDLPDDLSAADVLSTELAKRRDRDHIRDR
jgi:hypothetical protein